MRYYRIPRALLGALLLACSAAPGIAEPLGAADFATWSLQGEDQANFEFVDGELIGRPSKHEMKNSFLCSPAEYRDLRLSFEFRISPSTLNSGAQFRSRVLDDGRVAGPQLELEVVEPQFGWFARHVTIPVFATLARSDWRPRDWVAAGVWDESGSRGWIYPGDAGGDADEFAEQGEKLIRVDGWNRVALEAVGTRVRTWLNGEPRADYVDDMHSGAGVVCFQVHGGSYEDLASFEVRWRDIRIDDLAARRGPIVHSVFFDLSSAPGSAKERTFFEAAARLADIPSVQALERVEEVSASNGFRFGLTMRFASQADYDAYNTHPLHQAFVQEVWIPNVTSFQEIDYLAP